MKSLTKILLLFACLLLHSSVFSQEADDFNAAPIKLETGVKAKGNKESQADSLNPSRKKTTKRVSDRSRSVSGNSEEYYFQADKADSVAEAERKRLFGFSLFTNENLTFEPNLNIPTPKNYRLGPDDDLIIDIWGASQATYRQKITPEGNILIPSLGPIYLSGMTIEEATGKITKDLGAIYSGLRYGNSFIKVSLGSIRSIKVNMVGEISLPGTYTLSSLATVFNALYAADGPTVTGSLRDIRVIRNNKVAARIDLYELLLKGVQQDEIRLEDGDVIFIAPYQQRVDITGQINRPGLYDMKPAESLKDLIWFAGGFNSKAYTQRIKIFRNTGAMRKVLDIPASQQDSFQLRNGDKMVIDSILDKFENRVVIRGAVYRPGVFALDSVSTLKQLIRKADGLKGDAFTTRINIYRLRDDMTTEVIPVDLAAIMQNQEDVPLYKDDSVHIAPISKLHEKYFLQIEGEIRRPGKYSFMNNATMSDLILMAGGFKEAASLAGIEIARRVKNDTASKSVSRIAEVFRFPVSHDLKLSDSAARFILQPFDVISVLRSPGYGVPGMVTITGEVLYPGKYSIVTKNDRISDILRRAGNVTPYVNLKGASLMRKTNFIPARYSRLDTSATSDIENFIKELRTSANNVMVEDYVKMKDKKKNKSLTPVRKISPYTEVPVDLKYIINHPGGDKDLVLMPGDSLLLPREIQTVKTTGAVAYPATIPCKGKHLRGYIDRSGGFAPNADRSRVYVISANGSVRSTKTGFFGIRNFPPIEPGATIVVPTKK